MIGLSLSKLLGEALDPLAILWLVLFGIGWRFRKMKERKTSIIIFALWILVWCLGATPLVGWMMAKLEKPYVVHDWDALPKADAIVSLGGGFYPNSFEALTFSGNDAFDRNLTALDMVESGKADHIVFGGSDYIVDGKETSEGKLLNRWQKRWGLKEVEVHFLENSNTTLDEAIRVRELIESKNWESIYLVTSAWHMRRAKAVFLYHGVNVKAIGCDFQGATNVAKRRQWSAFPQSGNFLKLHLFTHEIVGYYYYQLRGWIA